MDCTRLIADCMKIKTPWEIEVMREAARIDDKVMNQVTAKVDVGITESQIANMVQKLALEESEELTQIIQVHTIGTDFSPVLIYRHNPLKAGDIVRLDGSTNLASYSSDIARTLRRCVQHPDENGFLAISAATSVTPLAAPGVPKWIRCISNTTPGCFEPNMIFCVEFPYYSSRNHCYNIEDEILITENGIERLAFANRTLMI